MLNLGMHKKSRMNQEGPECTRLDHIGPVQSGPMWSNVLVQSGPMYAHVFSMCLCLSVFVPVCVYECVNPRSFAGFVASFVVGVR